MQRGREEGSEDSDSMFSNGSVLQRAARRRLQVKWMMLNNFNGQALIQQPLSHHPLDKTETESSAFYNRPPREFQGVREGYF